MKTTISYFIIIPLLTIFQLAHGQQLVNVQVTMVPPVSPYLGQMLSTTGGRLMVQVIYNGQPGTTLQVKLAGKLERLSPSPLSIELNPSFMPAQPITLQAGIPVFLMNSQVEQAFGNIRESNLVFSGTSMSALKEGVNYKLPEGLYRLCMTAYSYGQGSQVLSNPNAGCAGFTVCYKAAPPQLVQPVNSLVVNSVMPVVNPASPVVFTWTAPTSTCGQSTAMVDYDFEIRKIFPGQTVTDAVNNPFVFQKKALPTATLLLDTLLYKNILRKGEKYIVRVKAYSKPGAQPIEIDNLGYSRVEAFQYGDTSSLISPGTGTTAGDPASVPVVPVSLASCGLSPIINKTSLADKTITNGDFTIGGFTLHIDNAVQKTDGSYSGEGYVLWKPLSSLPSSLRLAVLFSAIRINTDKVIYEGTVTTTTTASKPAWATVAQSKSVTDLLSKLNPTLAKEISDFATDIQPFSKLSGVSKIEMPLGWNTITGSKAVTLAILNIAFTPTGSDMTLLHSFNLTEAGPSAWLSLAGTGFCIKPDGFNFSKGNLYMPSDRSFTLGSGGEKLTLTLKGSSKAPADLSGGTYLSFTPGGIEKITASAEMLLPQTMLVRDEGGKIVAGDVIARFKFDFLDWEDWIAEGSIPAFQVRDIKGFSFAAPTIYYDHSQKRNAAGIVFPDEYTGLKTTAFDGLYIQKMDVTLPSGFRIFGSDKKISFSASHLLIDRSGITANIKGSSILNLATGSMGGWSFSVTDLGILVVNSTFRNGYMNGEFLLPVSNTPLGYSANLLKATGDLAYEFTVKPKDNMKMDMLLASLNLHSSSVFSIKEDAAGMAILTNLNGDISINAGGSATIAAVLPGLQFNNMAIANRNPSTMKEEFYFNAATWSFSSPPKSAGGFPVKINNIQPYTKPAGGMAFLAGLKFDVNVEIGFGDRTMISGVTTLDISGKVTASMKAAPKAEFNEIAVKKIKVEGDVGPVSIAGLLEFYKRDAVFGDGLKGKVAADFRIAKVEGTAQFGKTTTGDAFNYWFVDARAAFPKPIPLVGPLGLAGFGGGAFYNMGFTNDAPKGGDLGATVNLEDNSPGKTASGLNFTPQKGKAGLRATIITALTEPKSFNGDVTLTAVIDMAKGSFSQFGLEGNAYFVTDYPSNKNPFVKAAVKASYDIPSTTFNLNATVDAKFASVTARVPIGVYADPSKWFVKVGDPFGERVSFTFLDMSSAVLTAKLNANAYLAAGNVLDGGLPPLPAEVTGMSGMPASNPEIGRLVSDINSKPGGGFALGAQVRGDFRASFLMLYAQAKAILGFDLMMKNFTEPIECGGKPGGINNWYAIGQMYAYLKADVGVHVDVWFYEGDLSLCQVEAGAILNGGLPNPTWAQGRFAVNGSVLGGAVKVNTNFQFEMGDKCYPGPSDPLKDIRIVSDYGPAKADVFDEPYVVTNQPLGDVMEISIPPTEGKPTGEVRSYKFSMQSFQLFLNGSVLPDEGLQYSTDKTMVLKKHRTILEPRKTYTARVVCIAEQWYPELSTWDHPYNDKTKKKEAHSEVTEFSFQTGDAPIVIPEKNIVLSYPVKGQRFVLKNEMGGMARLQLKMWQPEILSSLKPMKWEMLFINTSKGDTVRSSFTPDAANNSLNYKLPSGLQNGAQYKVVFWPKPAEVNADWRNAVKNSIASVVTESTRRIGSEGTLTMTTRKAAASQPKAFDQPVYSFVFATSKYNSLSEKLSAMGDWKGKNSANKLSITNSGGVPENFDEVDVKGFVAPAGNVYPSLLNVQIGWDAAKQNDAFGKDKLYTNALVIAISGASINLGAPEVRKDIYKPVNTVDWSKLKTSPLITTGTAIVNQNMITNPGAMMTTITTGMGSISMTPAIATSASFQSVLNFPSHTILWTRETIMLQDFNLLKAFAKKLLAFEKDYRQLEKTLSSSALEGDDSPQLYTTNSIGGYAWVPLNKLRSLYGSSVNMNILKTWASMTYQYIPTSGNRNMLVNYGLKGFTTTSITKTITY